MTRLMLTRLQVLCACLLISGCLCAQVPREPRTDSAWTRDYPPFRIAGNLYYVGTYDLGCYLLVTNRGNILINTGLAGSADMIRRHITSLGFKFSDTRILLITHAHFDHVGALAEIKKETGATLMVDSADAPLLETGGASDYEMGKYGVSFAPVRPDRLLHDHDTVRLGDTRLVMLHHPGHTPGSCSYLFTVKDAHRRYRVLIANMPTIITDRRFSDISAYPNIAQDYAYTLRSLRSLHFDIWLASHASQFQLQEKHHPGDAYRPMAFSDQKGFLDELDDLQKAYDEKIQQGTTH